jgi:hypothetical protein
VTEGEMGKMTKANLHEGHFVKGLEEGNVSLCILLQRLFECPKFYLFLIWFIFILVPPRAFHSATKYLRKTT